MASRLKVGDPVQTSFGKGVVREVRNNGRLVVGVKDRALVLKEGEVSAIAAGGKRSRSDPAAHSRPHLSDGSMPARGAASDIDLHGLTVEEALARVEQALNDALLADVSELRLIHGRSGGRIRAALHRRLREIKSVREFEIDPRNAGVTIVGF